jgi:hypothetical protein
MNYVILVIGTPYMDGMYKTIEIFLGNHLHELVQDEAS